MSAEDDRREKFRLRLGRWFRVRWALVALCVVVIGNQTLLDVSDIGNHGQLTQIQANTAVLQAFDQLQTQTNAEQAKASQQQAIIFNNFFTEFLAEQNYLCRIASARAINSGLESPPAGICDVTLGPRAPPSPAP